MSQPGYYQQPGNYQHGNYQQGNYQQAPYNDVEANKPPPYSSTYVYGEQPQQTEPPPADNRYGEGDNLFPPSADDGDAGISAFSEKSVRQGTI